MVNNDFNRLKCPVCKRLYRDGESVILDEINTVKHQGCYTSDSPFDVIERGTYRYIIKKYDFFKEVR
ncbi:hypothetical protein VBD025_03905 [Virgibacillus flavescens]|uniref:hypothetical protein n=1 Tax=Virgibacillus flavescens TaxID=1611422 RepID=UPI003D3445C4